MGLGMDEQARIVQILGVTIKRGNMMMSLNMVRIANRSRKKPQLGDIFVFLMQPDGLFRYGRVVAVDIRLINATGTPSDLVGNLIYIYKTSASKKLPSPTLRIDNLLLPPQLLNDTGWCDGYFETIDQQPLTFDDVLPVHCFFDGSRKRYVDIHRRLLPRRYEPCGLYALGGYGAVDWDISKALGFPEPTEDEAGDTSEMAETDLFAAQDKQKRYDIEHAVILHIVNPPAGPLIMAFEQLEERLGSAAQQSGMGECDGHEFGLEAGSEARIYFYGKDADKLAEVLLPLARRAGLGRGSYLLKRYGEPGDAEECVDI